MPAKPAPEEQPQQQALPTPIYPAIEGFIETCTADDIAALFTTLREGLAGLKGPRAEQAKKVSRAIERTEELLTFLLQVRERLEAERKGTR